MLVDREARLFSRINLRSLLTYKLGDGIGHAVASLDGPLHVDECLSHRGAVCAHLGDELIEAAVQSTHVPVGKPTNVARVATTPRRARANKSVMRNHIFFAGSVTVLKINPISGLRCVGGSLGCWSAAPKDLHPEMRASSHGVIVS
jgi:hypothetical protein